MPSVAEELIEKELSDRLEKIAFHFKQRDDIREELEKYSPADPSGDPMKDTKIKDFVTRLQNEEVSMLYELVHLKDNVEKYFNVFRQNIGELDVIDKFRPFRVASNFVNTHKHGTRGRNRPSAKHDYSVLIFSRPSSKPVSEANVVDARSMINYEGEVFDSMELIEVLSRIWEMFLRYHTTHDPTPFVEILNIVYARRKGDGVHSAKLPKGILDDAKRNADARKHLNLS
jgi:hypothetical protein